MQEHRPDRSSSDYIDSRPHVMAGATLGPSEISPSDKIVARAPTTRLALSALCLEFRQKIFFAIVD